MEQTDAALAELARQLGISVGELWDWLQGNGIEAYAAARVAYGLTEVIGCLLLFAVCAVVFVNTSRALEKVDFDGEFCCVAALVTAGIIGIIAMIGVVLCVPSLVGWMVSPEGMVMDVLLN